MQVVDSFCGNERNDILPERNENIVLVARVNRKVIN